VKPRFSPAYVRALFKIGTNESLVEVSALLCGADSYDALNDNYGFESKTFVFVSWATSAELLAWM
jgi:hypothetical protein